MNIGDVVRLRSGGPHMTVVGKSLGATDSNSSELTEFVNVVWINPAHGGHKLENGTFPVEAVFLFDAKDKVKK